MCNPGEGQAFKRTKISTIFRQVGAAAAYVNPLENFVGCPAAAYVTLWKLRVSTVDVPKTMKQVRVHQPFRRHIRPNHHSSANVILGGPRCVRKEKIGAGKRAAGKLNLNRAVQRVSPGVGRMSTFCSFHGNPLPSAIALISLLSCRVLSVVAIVWGG